MTEPIIIEETYNIDYDIDSQTTDFTLNLTFRKTQFLVVKIAFYDQADQFIQSEQAVFQGITGELVFRAIEARVSSYEIQTLDAEGKIIDSGLLLIVFYSNL